MTNPKVLTVTGRLSFPTFSLQRAVDLNNKSQYPRKVDEVTPYFYLLLNQEQLDRFIAHVESHFLPFCLTDEAGKSKLDKEQVAKLTKVLQTGDWDTQPPYIAIKSVDDKTLALMPDAVAAIKVNGMRGQDIKELAVVNGPEELLVPGEEDESFPVLRPAHQTVHDVYAGCIAAATLNLYAFASSPKLPGFSTSASTCVFKKDADRFGGSVPIDEESIFMD